MSTRLKFIALFSFLAIALLVVVLGIRQNAARDAKEPVWADNVPTWNHMPLTVAWDELKSNAHDSSIKEAMQVWNREVGCELLRPARPNETVDIAIGPYMGAPCGREGSHSFDTDKNAIAGTWVCGGSVDIQFRTITDLVSTFRAATHEFGHALGLAHQSVGLMAPSFRVSDPSAFGAKDPGMVVLIPSDSQTKALKARYCK